MKEYIYNLIPTDRFIPKQELMDLTGLDERTIRRIISDIRKEHCIISISSGKGYRACKSKQEMTTQEINIEIEIIKHMLHEDNSRIKELKKNMRKKIARLKVLQGEKYEK